MNVSALCPGCQKKLTGRNRPSLERRALKHLETCKRAQRLAMASHEARTKHEENVQRSQARARQVLAITGLLGALSASGLAWFLGAIP